MLGERSLSRSETRLHRLLNKTQNLKEELLLLQQSGSESKKRQHSSQLISSNVKLADEILSSLGKAAVAHRNSCLSPSPRPSSLSFQFELWDPNDPMPPANVISSYQQQMQELRQVSQQPILQREDAEQLMWRFLTTNDPEHAEEKRVNEGPRPNEKKETDDIQVTSSTSPGLGLRLGRQPAHREISEEHFTVSIQQQHKKQQAIMEDILVMSKHLRENCEQSLAIVKDDNRTLDSMDTLSQQNTTRIKREKEKLMRKDHLVSNAYNLSLAVATALFFLLYMLIRSASMTRIL